MPLPRLSLAAMLCISLCFSSVKSTAAQQNASPAHQTLEQVLRTGKRPLVGVALSGGGARGLAHVGVLRALEELEIPVDRIAGTSMGALVGGLAACGYRPSEIEEVLGQADWNELYRNAAPRTRMTLFERQGSGRYLLSLPTRGFKIQLPAGVSEGDKITNLLSLLTVTAATTDFDALPIPFRAVATDLETGERVALGQGSLAEAIRASLAVPLFFTPVEVEGRLLIDGGLSDQLPVDVIEELGAELLIGSDVTSPLRGRDELDNPLGVGDQAISLQIVASARRMRKRAHAVLLPELEDLTSTDFGRASEIIRAGYESALASPELRRISLALRSFETASAPPRPSLVIGGLRLKGTHRYSRKKLEEAERSLRGRVLAPVEIQQTLDRVLRDQYFQKIRYTLNREQGSDPVLEVRVAERQTDDFNFSGRADDKYGALALVNFTFRGWGGWDNRAALDLQVGTFSGLAAEYLTPAVPGNAIFFRSRALWSNDFQLGYDTDGHKSEFVDRRWGGELAVGNTFRNLGAVTLGYRLTSVDFRRDTGDEILPPFEGHVSSIFLGSQVDDLDRTGIPDRGRRIKFQFEAARPHLGGDLDFDRLQVDYEGYHTWRDRHTLTTGLRFTTSFEDTLPASEQSRLGGVEYLWGLKREELRGNHVAGVRAGYRILIADLGAAFLSRLYLEVGADGANVWQERKLDGGLIPDGYVSLQARTWVGPLRIYWGWTEGGETNVTFSLGHSF